MILTTKPNKSECKQVVEAYLREIRYRREVENRPKLASKREDQKDMFIIHALEIHGENLYMELVEMNLDSLDKKGIPVEKENIE